MKRNNMSRWLYTREALEITKRYPKGPHSRSALIWAGKKANFIRKSKDGFHWEVNMKLLIDYCGIANQPTMKEIAKELRTNIGHINYLAIKNGIKFKTRMGRKYMDEKIKNKIIRIYNSYQCEHKK